MIGNLNRITIVVPDLNVAINHYQNILGAFVSSPQDLPDHGIQLATAKLPNILLDLITPLGENASLTSFLKNNPQGGVHHLCYEVADIEKARDQLVSSGIHLVGDGVPQPGYHGNPVLFFSPKDCLGTLIKIEETTAPGVIGRVEMERIGPIHTPPQTSPNTLTGVEGVGVNITVDFRHPTPEDNEEGE